MPADPSIYGDLKPIAILSPQQYQQQHLDQQLAVEDRQAKLRAAQDGRLVQDVFRRNAGDAEGTLAELQRVSPSAALSFQKVLSEQRKSGQEAAKTQLEVQKSRTEQGLQRLNLALTTKSEAAYQSAIALLAMDDEDRAAFPPHLPDEATGQKMLQMGASVKELHDINEDALKHYAAGDVQKGFGLALLGAGNDPAAWQEAVQAGVQLGVPKALAESFAQPSPENVARAQATVQGFKPEKAAATPNIGSFEDYVTRTYGQNPTPEQVLAARKAYGQADDRAPRVTVNAGGGTPGGLDEGGLELAATRFRLTGQLPARDSKQNAAIMNAAAKQAKEIGSSPAATIQKQAAYKGDAAALNQMQKMSASAESFETKATMQAALIEDLSKKVSRTAFPVINSALQSGRTNITGDTNATQLANAIETFTEEYAKVMSGSTGSAAAATDSTRAASKRLINAAMSKGTMSDVLRLMQREMQLTMQGYDTTIQHITERMGGTTPAAAPAAKADPLGIR